LALLLCLGLAIAPARADGEAAAGFVAETFAAAPETGTVWLSGELRRAAAAILGHDYPAARLRYWRLGNRTAWVLDEIGKELPITVGIGVDAGRVRAVRVLVYRESRGWEVKSPAFTAQFDGATLTPSHKLDRGIDGISGATLSVRALTRLTRLALLLHGHVTGPGTSPP
jgi:hypothetical protein